MSSERDVPPSRRECINIIMSKKMHSHKTESYAEERIRNSPLKVNNSNATSQPVPDSRSSEGRKTPDGHGQQRSAQQTSEKSRDDK